MSSLSLTSFLIQGKVEVPEQLYIDFSQREDLQEMASKSSFIVSIQFPPTLESIPSVRVYYKGTKVDQLANPSSADQRKNAKVFSITKDNNLDFIFLEDNTISTFHLFITDMVVCGENDKNTISHLTIPAQTPFIEVKIIKIVTKEKIHEETSKDGSEKKQKAKEIRYIKWPIDSKEEIIIQNSDQPTPIPDNALIVLMNPDLVSSFGPAFKISEGKAFFFPKIMVNEQLNAQEIYEKLINALLYSIDIDTFHARAKQEKIAAKGVILKSTRN